MVNISGQTQTCPRDLLSLLLLHYRVGYLACLLQTAKPPSAATDRISTGEQRVRHFRVRALKTCQHRSVALPLGERAPLKGMSSRGNHGSTAGPRAPQIFFPRTHLCLVPEVINITKSMFGHLTEEEDSEEERGEKSVGGILLTDISTPSKRQAPRKGGGGEEFLGKTCLQLFPVENAKMYCKVIIAEHRTCYR